MQECFWMYLRRMEVGAGGRGQGDMVGLILVEAPALGKAATLWGSGPGYHVLFGAISILKGRLSPKASAGRPTGRAPAQPGVEGPVRKGGGLLRTWCRQGGGKRRSLSEPDRSGGKEASLRGPCGSESQGPWAAGGWACRCRWRGRFWGEWLGCRLRSWASSRGRGPWAAGSREGRGRPVGDVRLQRAGWKVQVRRRWAAWGDPGLA